MAIDKMCVFCISQLSHARTRTSHLCAAMPAVEDKTLRKLCQVSSCLLLFLGCLLSHLGRLVILILMSQIIAYELYRDLGMNGRE